MTPDLLQDFYGEIGPAGAPHAITPSESIGPMQGAILPTLLPLLAVKPFDIDQRVLTRFDHLRIPARTAPLSGAVGLAVALDGPQKELPLTAADGLAAVWRGGDGRFTLFVGSCPASDGLLVVRNRQACD